MKTIDLVATKNLSISDDVSDVIEVFKISEYITWTELECSTDEELCIRLNEGNNTYLHFINNLKDSGQLTSMGSDKSKHLTSFQSALLHEKDGLTTHMNLNKNSDYRIGIVQMIKYGKNGEVNDFFMQFEEVFQSMSAESYYMHTGLPNLELGEYVKKLMDMSKSDISDKIMAAGYINILLSLKLKQFVEHRVNLKIKFITHKKRLLIVKKLSDRVVNEPHINYNLDDLCIGIGLSASKLQEGFKDMHGRTVNNFICHIRLLKAEQLLKNSDLNISEIVYSLGWSSRSYFSKIFKEKIQLYTKFLSGAICKR